VAWWVEISSAGGRSALAEILVVGAADVVSEEFEVVREFKDESPTVIYDRSESHDMLLRALYATHTTIMCICRSRLLRLIRQLLQHSLVSRPSYFRSTGDGIHPVWK
jgi:hypothetical protein